MNPFSGALVRLHDGLVIRRDTILKIERLPDGAYQIAYDHGGGPTPLIRQITMDAGTPEADQVAAFISRVSNRDEPSLTVALRNPPD